jgi:aryl-alcohol dehydrogenase-like predicted oxidoreductase
MEYVTADGLPPVSKIGLGTMRFGEKGFDPDLARALVRRALELGINCFDTAEAYGFGRGERLLGQALAAEGATDAMITSKYSPLLPLPPVTERHARASRTRLGVQQIPLYLLHMPNPLFPQRMIMRGFRQAQETGIIGAAGVSNHSLSQWQAAETALGHPVAANQILLNLLHRKPLDDLVPWAAHNRRLVITASPLGQGMLTGRYDHDHPPAGLPWPRRLALRHSALPPTPANLRRLAPLLEQLRATAARHHVTPAAIALAWAISHNPVVVIPGASTISQLEANTAAADITLTPSEQQALTAAGALLRSGQPRRPDAKGQRIAQVDASPAQTPSRTQGAECVPPVRPRGPC